MKSILLILSITLGLITLGAALAADQTSLPGDYRGTLQRLGVPTLGEFGVTTAYGNELAASVTETSPMRYPDGAVIVMEFAKPERDASGELVRDENGLPLRSAIYRIDVMRRVAGFGDAYGDSRAGEWEFSSYLPDGSPRISFDQSAECAACHRGASAERDFVFRKRSWTAAD